MASRKHAPRLEEFSISRALVSKAATWAVVAVGTLLANILSSGVDYVKRLSDSVNDLNRNIVVILERLGTHDKKLERHEWDIEEIKRTIPLEVEKIGGGRNHRSGGG